MTPTPSRGPERGTSAAGRHGELLRARLRWEAENTRPESLRRAERAIVRALAAEGFGRQYQVTRKDGFDIAVDDLVITVRRDPEASNATP